MVFQTSVDNQSFLCAAGPLIVSFFLSPQLVLAERFSEQNSNFEKSEAGSPLYNACSRANQFGAQILAGL